jgi:hypothetical protein
MSQTDFKISASANISISINASGTFSPLQGEFGGPVDWTLEGVATGLQFSEQRTTREKTCGLDYDSPKRYADFDMLGSVGNTSGTINVGTLPSRGFTLANDGGIWEVNTNPVLSNGGKADNVLSQNIIYTVGLPKTEGAKTDDPIFLDPAIDEITRVYAGDKMVTELFQDPDGTVSGKWRVIPQERFPLPDRTFWWIPNTDPTLQSGGIVNGELALPGTIMLPENDYYIPISSDAFDGMRYFYQNQGVMFNGYVWSKNLPDPYVYKQNPTSEPEFRNFNVKYNSSERYQFLLESMHASKPYITTNQQVDDSNVFVYRETYDSGFVREIEMVFRWGDFDNSRIQRGPLIYNHSDIYSKYALENLDWRVARNLEGGLLTLYGPEQYDIDGNPYRLKIQAECVFKDGYTTDTQEVIPFGGNEYLNSFSVTVQALTSKT